MDAWDKSNGFRNLCRVRTTTPHGDNNVTFKRTIKDKRERLTRSNRNSFCHIPSEESYSLRCFGICVPERKRTEGMQETQQCEPSRATAAVTQPPPPTIVHDVQRLKSFIQHKAQHKPPASTNTVFTTNAYSADNENATPKKKKKEKLQGCRNGAEITAFERNISDVWKLSLSPHPLMGEVRKRWACFELENFL